MFNIGDQVRVRKETWDGEDVYIRGLRINTYFDPNAIHTIKIKTVSNTFPERGMYNVLERGECFFDDELVTAGNPVVTGTFFD